MASPKLTTLRRNRSSRSGRRRRKIAFGWYGGKFSHLDFLLPNLPNDARHFCDVFGGSAAVLINREPALVETYNDLDSELVNFFATLRHPENGERLLKEIALTPFSRRGIGAGVYAGSPIGRCGTGAAVLRARTADPHRTGANIVERTLGAVHLDFPARGWPGQCLVGWAPIEGLPPIIDRLMRVQIENAPALEVIQRYDTPETLFYLDPPYVHDARGDKHAYYGEMTDAEHAELAELLRGIKGRAAISGYRNELYDALYAGWNRVGRARKDLPFGAAAPPGIPVAELRAAMPVSG